MDDVETEYSYSNTPESYELNDTGIMGESSESETDVLFRNLEEELRGLMRSYSVQPSDLEQLFQVVHQMFEIMDANQESLNVAHAEKQELEALWMQAKTELRNTKREKANLQSLLDDEEMRHESEKVEFEKEKAVMATRIKQMEEYKHIVEQDLVKVKEKMNQNDQKRTEILELYKKTLDRGKTATLKSRRGGMGTSKHRTLPRLTRTAVSVGGVADKTLEAAAISEKFLSTTLSAREESLMSTVEMPAPTPATPTYPHDELDERDLQRLARPSWVVQSQARQVNRSLAEELRSEGEEITSSLSLSVRPSVNNNSGTNNNNILGANQDARSKPISIQGPAGGGVLNYDSMEEDDSFEEEFFEEDILAVDPQMITEVEMLQKEKEGWEVEEKKLEEDKRRLREAKDEFERQNIQLQVELKRLKDSRRELQEKLTDVKNERDKILDNYLEQPFDEYCITRKELHKLLMEQQTTKMELEKAREEKYRLQQQLLSKRSIFEKFRQRMKKLLTKQHNSSPSVQKKELDTVPKSLPPPLPLLRDVTHIIEKGDYVIKKGWFMSKESRVLEHKLPNWMGQITFKGVETERLECSAVARIFQSPMKGPPLNLKNHTPQQQVALLSSVQQLHVEVWTASVEGPSVRIEIIDVIARPPKVRQRFVMKPKTSHVVCMFSIPGTVEASRDFTDSISMSQELEEATKPYKPPSRHSSSYVGPRFGQKGRPFSAPKEKIERSSSVITKSPNLNLSSTSDTGPLSSLELPSPGPVRSKSAGKKFSKKKQASSLTETSRRATETSLSSSSCTMLTIHEQSSPGKGVAGDGATRNGMGESASERIGVSEEIENGGVLAGKCDSGSDDVDNPGNLDGVKTDEDNASLSVSSLEVEMEEPLKLFSMSGRGLPSEDRLGFSDDETKYQKPSGYRKQTFTSTPKRSSLYNSDFRKFSESCRHDGLLRDRREEPARDEYDYDCVDGEDLHAPATSEPPEAPVMWIITEEQNLVFFPTTDPSHKAINKVKLRHKGRCLEYVSRIGEQRPRVFIGHARAKISIYCMDEFKSDVWDIDNPDEITLSTFSPDEVDVHCMTHVKDRLWVGAGESIFFLNAENPSISEGSIFLDGPGSKTPEAILRVGSVVVVTSRSSVFYVFDADSARELRRFDVSAIARQLDLPTSSSPGAGAEPLPSTSHIKSMVADSDFLYLGTSNGHIVTVPIPSLTQPSSVKWGVDGDNTADTKTDSKSSEPLMAKSIPHLAVAVHRQMEGSMHTLLQVKLPGTKLSKLKEAAEMLRYHSLPNLHSPLGGRIPVSPPILSFRSLVVAAGKGHVEYVSKDEEGEKTEEVMEVHRERNEAFQMLVWGHKNTVSS